MGWVLEPEAKRLLSLTGISVPRFAWPKTPEEAVAAAESIHYPLVAKIVSPEIVHKSDAGGVTVGIQNDAELIEVFNRYSQFKGFAGVLIEEMVAGFELILGAKIDYQFGPVVLLGIGGTSVEVYQDTAIRMAPLSASDAREMIDGLKGSKLLKGYRGAEAVDISQLADLMIGFSKLVMDLEDLIESIDLNPVKCTGQYCVVADARIMLNPNAAYE
jgi:acyl-CoA synthetase (NDP forming)